MMPASNRVTSPKCGEVPAGAAVEGKVGGSASGDVLVVTRSQEKARAGASKWEKGKSTMLDWDAQEKVRSTVEEMVKETPSVIKKLREKEILPATEKSVKVAGGLQGQQLEKVQPSTSQRDSPTIDEEEAEPYDLW